MMVASVMRTSALTVAKFLMRQNPVRVMLTSARGALSHAQVANGNDYAHEHEHEHCDDQLVEMVPKEESHKIHLHTTDDTLKVNLEHVCSNLQKELIEQLGPFLKETAHNDQIPNVSFNYVTEDVYRNNLYMEFRKLGYECVFTRYNHDTGLATFSLKDPEEPEVKYSYFRSGLPNTC